MDVAEKVLVAAYKARDAIDAIRHNFMSAAELARAEEGLDKDGFNLSNKEDNEKRRIIQAQAILTRINNNREEFAELYSVMPLVKAFYGRDLEEQLEAFIRARSRITVSAEMYAEDDGKDRELSQSIRADLWTGHGMRAAEDPIVGKMNTAITALEAKFLPMLRSEEGSKEKARPASGLTGPSGS